MQHILRTYHRGNIVVSTVAMPYEAGSYDAETAVLRDGKWERVATHDDVLTAEEQHWKIAARYGPAIREERQDAGD